MKHRPLSPLAIFFLLAGSSCEAPGSAAIPLVPIAQQSLTVVSSQSDALWDVRDVIDIGDTYWALTASAPFVHGFGPTGELRSRFGSSGQGPGEFRFPSAVWPGQDRGSLTVWDPGTLLALTFSPDGALVSSLRAPTLGAIRSDIATVTFGDPFRAITVPGGILTAHYASGVNHADDLWNGRLVVVPDDGGDLEPLIDFADELPGASARSDATLLVPVPLWDGCADGRIAILDPLARKLFVLDPATRERTEIALPWQPRELQEDARVAYMVARVSAEVGDEDVSEAEIREFAQAAARNGASMFAAEEPIGVDLKCAPGRVWIQEFQHSFRHPLGFGPSWRTVTLDRQPATFSRVVFPDGFNPSRITESRAIGVVEDPMGLQRVATVSLSSTSRQASLQTAPPTYRAPQAAQEN